MHLKGEEEKDSGVAKKSKQELSGFGCFKEEVERRQAKYHGCTHRHSELKITGEPGIDFERGCMMDYAPEGRNLTLKETSSYWEYSG